VSRAPGLRYARATLRGRKGGRRRGEDAPPERRETRRSGSGTKAKALLATCLSPEGSSNLGSALAARSAADGTGGWGMGPSGPPGTLSQLARKAAGLGTAAFFLCSRTGGASGQDQKRNEKGSYVLFCLPARGDEATPDVTTQTCRRRNNSAINTSVLQRHTHAPKRKNNTLYQSLECRWQYCMCTAEPPCRLKLVHSRLVCGSHALPAKLGLVYTLHSS
jgi:hypothetical protein